MRRASLAALAAVLVLAHAQGARAWVCTRSDGDGKDATGPSLSWSRRDLAYAFLDDRFLPGEAYLQALRDSFVVWSGAVACNRSGTVTDLTFTETARSTIDRVGYDYEHPDQNENLLVFRGEGWPIPGQDGVIALTTVTYARVTGEILDADIEFNSSGFEFSLAPGAGQMDLMNTAVHEIGHYLGLAHSPVVEATMYSQGQYGETAKRDLACDDRDGIVFKYPAGEPNGYCNPATDESCGYCAPPETPSKTVEIAMDPGGCAAAVPGPLAAAAAVLILARGAGRRRRTLAGRSARRA